MDLSFGNITKIGDQLSSQNKGRIKKKDIRKRLSDYY